MKRPTIRMSDVLAQYVEDVFHATNLDRNQIVRLLMMTAPSSKLFHQKVARHLKTGAAVPLEPWKAHHDQLYIEQDATIEAAAASQGVKAHA